MKRPIAVLSVIAVAAWALFAEGSPSFTLSGTVDPGVSISLENEDSAFAGSSSSSSSEAGAYIDGKLSFSREYESLGLLDFTFQDAALIDHEDGSTAESMSFKVNELYTDLNFGDLFYLRLGKQRLRWGSGYVFNPSDPVNPPKDPTSQRAVREGVPALKAEIIAKPVSLMTFAVLHDDYREMGYGAKISTSALPNSDISLSGYWSPSQSWTEALNASVAPLYAIPGWDSLQLWFEGGACAKDRYEAYAGGGLAGSPEVERPSGTQYSALFGGSGQLPVLRTVLLAEFYHISEGLSSSEIGSIYEAVRASSSDAASTASAWLSARSGRLAKDYLYLSLTQSAITDSGDPILDKIGLSLSCLVNLVDRSTYAAADLSFTFVKDSSIDLTSSWARGGEDSEFGNAPAWLDLGLEVKVFF